LTRWRPSRFAFGPKFDLRQSINRLLVNVLGVIWDAALRLLVASWELIMDFVKSQESLEPPVDTGVDTGPADQSDVMDEAVPNLEAESEAVTLVPSLEGESEATANSIDLLLQRVAGSSIDEIDRRLSCRPCAACCRRKRRGSNIKS
jgi:hypothetical protein